MVLPLREKPAIAIHQHQPAVISESFCLRNGGINTDTPKAFNGIDDNVFDFEVHNAVVRVKG